MKQQQGLFLLSVLWLSVQNTHAHNAHNNAEQRDNKTEVVLRETCCCCCCLLGLGHGSLHQLRHELHKALARLFVLCKRVVDELCQLFRCVPLMVLV